MESKGYGKLKMRDWPPLKDCDTVVERVLGCCQALRVKSIDTQGLRAVTVTAFRDQDFHYSRA
jgi:hypothetical protein